MSEELVGVTGKYMETRGWWVFFYREDGVEVKTGLARQDILDMAPEDLEGASIYKEVSVFVPVNHSVKDGEVVLDA